MRYSSHLSFTSPNKIHVTCFMPAYFFRRPKFWSSPCELNERDQNIYTKICFCVVPPERFCSGYTAVLTTCFSPVLVFLLASVLKGTRRLENKNNSNDLGVRYVFRFKKRLAFGGPSSLVHVHRCIF